MTMYTHSPYPYACHSAPAVQLPLEMMHCCVERCDLTRLEFWVAPRLLSGNVSGSAAGTIDLRMQRCVSAGV